MNLCQILQNWYKVDKAQPFDENLLFALKEVCKIMCYTSFGLQARVDV